MLPQVKRPEMSLVELDEFSGSEEAKQNLIEV